MREGQEAVIPHAVQRQGRGCSALAALQAASCSLFITVNSSQPLKRAQNRDGARAEDVAAAAQAEAVP